MVHRRGPCVLLTTHPALFNQQASQPSTRCRWRAWRRPESSSAERGKHCGGGSAEASASKPDSFAGHGPGRHAGEVQLADVVADGHRACPAAAEACSSAPTGEAAACAANAISTHDVIFEALGRENFPEVQRLSISPASVGGCRLRSSPNGGSRRIFTQSSIVFVDGGCGDVDWLAPSRAPTRRWSTLLLGAGTPVALLQRSLELPPWASLISSLLAKPRPGSWPSTVEPHVGRGPHCSAEKEAKNCDDDEKIVGPVGPSLALVKVLRRRHRRSVRAHRQPTRRRAFNVADAQAPTWSACEFGTDGTRGALPRRAPAGHSRQFLRELETWGVRRASAWAAQRDGRAARRWIARWSAPSAGASAPSWQRRAGSEYIAARAAPRMPAMM